MQHQIEVFPQGQIVVKIGRQHVGTTSSLEVLWDKWKVEHTWHEITCTG